MADLPHPVEEKYALLMKEHEQVSLQIISNQCTYEAGIEMLKTQQLSDIRNLITQHTVLWISIRASKQRLV